MLAALPSNTAIRVSRVATSMWNYARACGLAVSFHCGVYGTVGNGVGGHKTRLGKQAKMRKRNQQRAFAHLWEQWREHNGTIGARLTNENGQLLQWNQTWQGRCKSTARKRTFVRRQAWKVGQEGAPSMH